MNLSKGFQIPGVILRPGRKIVQHYNITGMLPFRKQFIGFKNAGLLETIKQLKKDLVKIKLLNKKLIANIDEYLLSL